MDSAGTPTAQKRPREKNAAEQQPRKRARQSCETCKARKTKYCAQLGVPCEVNLKNRKRPFYRVSEEVYESSITLLRRFVSEEELPELTVEGIQSILAKLSDANGIGNGNARPTSPRLQQQQDQQQPQNGHANKRMDDADGLPEEVMEPDEHPVLQEERGCMLLDSLGKYRYVGADSSIRWNHAARVAQQTFIDSDPKVIPPLKTGLLPPTTPESPMSTRRGEIYLPPRQLCMRYVGYFFEEVHCLYWFYSPEQFYSLLDQTLEDRGTRASSSWLCSLYSIFAIGSMVPSNQIIHSGSAVEHAGKQAPDYLTLAKELSAGAADEADIESVKAFGLLSLAMHAMCYSVGAYLHLGTAVRIGFSLGLHRDISPRTRDSVERERGRRLWWTIYTLDHEMAIRFGYPCAIGEDAGFVKTPPASEQIMDPGPNMPLGYQALSSSLVRLRKRISYTCFIEPAQVGGRLPISRVTESLNDLKSWLDNAPPYLHWDSSHPPQHRRPVLVLHLRYWSSVISVTRPFLLFTVSRPSTIVVPAKRACYEELSGKCIEAAELSVQILKRMVDDRGLSSRILFDCHCIGEVMWILILAVQKLGRPEHQDMLRFCLETVTSMERIGWCEKISPELEARIHESGALEPLVHLQIQTNQHQQQKYPDGIEGRVIFPPESGPSYVDGTADFNFDASQFDVFETLDLDTRSGLMDIFADATLSASHLVFDIEQREI
ncbi:Fungal specific transcription factor, putative [Coccidioides posadasii C735 delta SOWgp]|uniref:Fungal specific transcription factor, putative n=1 Tax=Coccidioides posadasii (strain C735) TaxID=222929 RepID=C5P0W5_COCP7|nr:Fungal specific transcription factor, putative [Coccidioides posadasii C735 delta SOWgp]EER29323.1 Fungal specific transcription factor, putative [Coccidioides posadasii C735 delta SOWgp]|eukprot:XP_003071468.1 Fungal specific transcription factor, putative [Coccidioides posadasii C735 delta SOWgp]